MCPSDGGGLSATDVAQLVTAATAVVALGYAGFQIRVTRNLARQTLVYNYMDRLNSAEMIPLITATRDFFDVPDEDRTQKFKEFWDLPRCDRQMLLLPLNTFEELGGMYNKKMLDSDAVKRLLRSTSISYWREFEWVITKVRNDRNAPRAWVEWEQMNESLEAADGPKQKRAKRR